jgi:CHAT domain-containing protein
MAPITRCCLVALAFATGLWSCSTVSLKEQSRIQEHYRVQKQYDLLEKSLKEGLARYEQDDEVLGQLYSSLDLGELYTQGFINFTQATNFYNKAAVLNEQIHARTEKKSKPEIFFRHEGEFAHERVYDYEKVKAEIETGKQYIHRLLGDPPQENEHKTGLSRNVSFARTASSVLFPQENVGFHEFEKTLHEHLLLQFAKRYKLSFAAKEFFIHSGLAKALVRSFHLSELSPEQLQRIVEHAQTALTNSGEIEDLRLRAYLNFTTAVCDAYLRVPEKAISAFTEFQNQVDQFNRQTREDIQALEDTQRRDRVRTTAAIAAAIAADLLIGTVAGPSGGLGSYTNFSGGLRNIDKGAAYTSRLIKFAGESEYAKGLNTVLNQDEQLLLFDAMGLAYHQVENLERSVFFNGQAIAIINQLRGTIASEAGRINFARQKDAIFNRLIDDLARQGKWDEAWLYSENARARALVDLLGSHRDLRFKDKEATDHATDVRQRQLYMNVLQGQTEISQEQAEYANAYFAPSTARGIHVVQGAIQNAPMSVSAATTGPVSLANKEKTDAFQVDLSRPPMNELDVLLVVGVNQLREVQQLLPSDSALIEFYVSESTIYAWLIEKSASVGINLEVKPEDLKNQATQFYRLLVDETSAHPSRQTLSLSKTLYDQLFRKLEPFIRHHRLYVVSHRFLHFLPLESLHDGEDYLVKRLASSYLPSASVFSFLKEKNKLLRNILIFGNPTLEDSAWPALPYAETEAMEIAKLFAPAKVLTQQLATEMAFRNHAPQFDIVHLATHGLLDAAHPLNSRLMLARESQHDGQLLVAELYGIQLNSSLVTLSACETGLSAIANGDELIGLLRGLFYAGARSVLASLWKVDDHATMQLMTSFYRHLQRVDKMEALRLAKIDLLNTATFSHPFYWAAFDLFGMGD